MHISSCDDWNVVRGEQPGRFTVRCAACSNGYVNNMIDWIDLTIMANAEKIEAVLIHGKEWQLRRNAPGIAGRKCYFDFSEYDDELELLSAAELYERLKATRSVIKEMAYWLPKVPKTMGCENCTFAAERLRADIYRELAKARCEIVRLKAERRRRGID